MKLPETFPNISANMQVLAHHKQVSIYQVLGNIILQWSFKQNLMIFLMQLYFNLVFTAINEDFGYFTLEYLNLHLLPY